MEDKGEKVKDEEERGKCLAEQQQQRHQLTKWKYAMLSGKPLINRI